MKIWQEIIFCIDGMWIFNRLSITQFLFSLSTFCSENEMSTEIMFGSSGTTGRAGWGRTAPRLRWAGRRGRSGRGSTGGSGPG